MGAALPAESPEGPGDPPDSPQLGFADLPERSGQGLGGRGRPGEGERRAVPAGLASSPRRRRPPAEEAPFRLWSLPVPVKGHSPGSSAQRLRPREAGPEPESPLLPDAGWRPGGLRQGHLRALACRGGWGSRAVLDSATPNPLQFQGEWIVLALAGSTHKTADRSLLSPFTATFVQNQNDRWEVSYAMIR